MAEDEPRLEFAQEPGLQLQARGPHLRVPELDGQKAAQRGGVLILFAPGHLQFLGLQQVGQLRRRLGLEPRADGCMGRCDQGHAKGARSTEAAAGRHRAASADLPARAQSAAPHRGLDQIELPVVDQLAGRLDLERLAQVGGAETDAGGALAHLDQDVQSATAALTTAPPRRAE